MKKTTNKLFDGKRHKSLLKHMSWPDNKIPWASTITPTLTFSHGRVL